MLLLLSGAARHVVGGPELEVAFDGVIFDDVTVMPRDTPAAGRSSRLISW